MWRQTHNMRLEVDAPGLGFPVKVLEMLNDPKKHVIEDCWHTQHT